MRIASAGHIETQAPSPAHASGRISAAVPCFRSRQPFGQTAPHRPQPVQRDAETTGTSRETPRIPYPPKIPYKTDIAPLTAGDKAKIAG